MASVLLRHGRDSASFVWFDDLEHMTVVIDVEAMRNSQTGQMTKDAARLLWKTLISTGFKECPYID